MALVGRVEALRVMTKTALRYGALMATLVVAAACNEKGGIAYNKGAADAQVPARLKTEMAKQGMPLTSPVVARVFKEENKVEIWKQKANGRYAMLTSYEICKYSGKLGPKYTEGDRQAPEGFYTVRPAQMNPNSQYHLSFDMGYPNKYDRANGRTGSNLMVHGACSSSGCYSMNDGPMTEIYAVAREAFKGGQQEFQIQAYPFRMTAQNMARYRNDTNIDFWKNLKEGYDAFETTKVPPKVDVCGKRYVFNQTLPIGASATAACPSSVTVAETAFQSSGATHTAAFAAATNEKDIAPPKPSIQGIKEAELVKDWTKRRARGERISMDPPSLNSDGTVTTGSRMGRANNEAGRKMAALEAEEARKKREAEEKAAAAAEAKRLKEEAKAQAEAEKAAKKAAKEAEANGQPAQAAVEQPVPPAPVAEPADEGIIGNARKRLGALLGG